MIQNKLFIICPFSNLEFFLQKYFGKNSFFLTFSCAIIETQDYQYLETIRDFIVTQNIQTVYIVNDVNCRFINNIISNKKSLGLWSENILQNLYFEEYFTHFKNKPLAYQQYKLAELNVMNQINNMQHFSLLQTLLINNSFDLKGLITCMNTQKVKEIKTKELAYEPKFTY